MGTPLTNTHRFFIQFMLNNGQATLNNALAFFEELNPVQNSLTHLKALVIEINREICNHSFKIVLTTCEVTGQKVFVWLNTKHDQISRLQIGHSAIELEYFHAILQEIISGDEHRITYPRAINLSSTLSATFSRDNGEKSFTKWTHGGYFIKKDADVYLGPRTILEYTTYLRTHTENSTCDLCSELVFVGQTCTSCDKTFHAFCLEKYFQNQHTCPSCKSDWQDPEMDVDPDSQNDISTNE